MSNGELHGCRVLVVEDELLVAMLVEELMVDAGCVVVGPFSRVTEAMVAARTADLGLAVLDVNVDGAKIYPVAEVLTARGVPLVLLSGYGAQAAPRDHPEWPVCGKPFRAQELMTLMTAQVRRARAAVGGA